MPVKIKPHIKLVRRNIWSCSGHETERKGVGKKQAYDRWCVAVAKKAAPTHVANPKVRRVTSGSKPKAAPPAPTVQPGPIRNPIAEGAAGLAAYSETMVRQVQGTVISRPYVPPVGLQLNGRRAAQVQPRLLSIMSSTNPSQGRYG